MNPRAAINDLLPFQGSPFSHLGTSPAEFIKCIQFIELLLETEKVGFEPTAPFGVTGFQDRLLKPLGHLSLLISNSEANESIPYFEPYVNLKLRFLWAVFSEPQNRGGQPAGPRLKRPLEKTGSACSAGRFRFLI